MKSLLKKRDKEVFDMSKVPIDEFAASLGLPMTPRIRFFNKKERKEEPVEATLHAECGLEDGIEVVQRRKHKEDNFKKEDEDDILVSKETSVEVEGNGASKYVNSS